MRWSWVSILPFVALVATWAGVTSSGWIDPVFLPPPNQVLRSFVALFSGEFLDGHLLPSLFRVTAAFLISVAIALPLGLLSGQVPWVASLTEPLCGFTRYLPVPAIVPLCILWFGIGDEQKIAVITIGVLFQMILLFSSDFAAVPKELIELGRTYGLTKGQIMTRVALPWAMPSVWDHMRVSAGWAWSYLVLAELVAGNVGVGYFVIQSQRFLETDRVFAGILFIGVLGAITDTAFRLSERKLFSWR